ncbi:MAG: hypothetical protein ACFFG0_13710 [Candidatus Thorarchaeota archaeon]
MSKNIKRAKLYPKLNSICGCRGTIDRSTQVWGSFGLNDENNWRILLVRVCV